MIILLPVALLCVASFALAFAVRLRMGPPPAVVLLRAGMEPCGCLRLEGGLVLPCPGHDPAAEPPVEQWAAEMEEQ